MNYIIYYFKLQKNYLILLFISFNKIFIVLIRFLCGIIKLHYGERKAERIGSIRNLDQVMLD